MDTERQGFLWFTTDRLGGKVSFSYTANGNKTAVIDQLGKTSSYTYDAANQRTATTLPDSSTEVTLYDALRRKSKVLYSYPIVQRASIPSRISSGQEVVPTKIQSTVIP